MSTGVVNVVARTGVMRATWNALGEGEVGDKAEVFGDRIVVQVTGNFAGENVNIEGSIDGSNWFQLTINGIDGLTFDIPALKTAYEAVSFLRPVATETGGGLMAVTVIAEGIIYGH